MKYFKNYRLRIIIFISFFTMIIFKCNQQNDHLINTEFQTEIKNDSVSINQKIIPMREYWSPGSWYSREVWVFDHYEPVTTGKVLGIWPAGPGTPDWSRLRTKWGFTGIIVDPSRYQDAINSGFNWKNMMVSVGPTNYQSTIDTYLSGAYYSSEPTAHNCIGSWNNPEWQYNLYLIPIIRQYANSRSSKYIIDAYWDCNHLLDVFNSVDVLMFDGYRKMSMITNECFYSPSNDQRDTWTRWRTLFPDKFTRVWVSAGPGNRNDDDYDEYNDLIGHATPRFNAMWLFVGPDGTENQHVDSFCYYSWRWGWLRRFERLTYIIYECICSGGCYTPPLDPCWIQIGTQQTSTLREVFP